MTVSKRECTKNPANQIGLRDFLVGPEGLEPPTR